MQRLLMAVLISACIGTLPVFAGETHVSGPVSGVWGVGESIFVDGPIWIERDARLSVEPGVRIQCKTAEAIEVYGVLSIQGDATNPVLLSTPDNWEGFNFRPSDVDHKCTLQFVWFAEDAGVPQRVVTGHGAFLDLNNCDFRAKSTCLEMVGGRIRAYQNRLMTLGFLESAVILRDLHYGGWNTNPCEDPEGSSLAGDNMIYAVVPDDGQSTPGQIFTCGLYVRNCTRLCVDNNSITVDAPGNTVGAYFTYDSDQGFPRTDISWCVISVRSHQGQAQGIFNALDGLLYVIHCTIDAFNQNETLSDPNGVVASDDAAVYVNSSIVRLNRGDNFFQPRTSGAIITVDRVTTWGTAGAIMIPTEPDDDTPIFRSDVDTVVYNGPIFYADPQFAQAIEWGAWRNPEEVQAYYSLRGTSPCIDNGDVQFGYDPDNTLPDIGRYYYPQSANDTPDQPGHSPLALALAPPFPNPFNATTVVPFLLNRAGKAEISVYNLLGRRVAVLASGQQQAGSHEVRFDAGGLPSGLYLIALEFEGARVATQPVLLIK